MQTRQPVVEIIHPIVVESLRRMSPAERLNQAFAMWESARNMVRGVLRQEHPDWTEEQILREAARRLSHGATERVPR
jgi:hypothetical protein